MEVIQTNKTRLGQLLCLLGILITFFAYFSADIWDSDFWLHIATGKWVVENNALPTVDPFQVFSDSNKIRNDTVLKGQWLGQVALYKVYDLFGAQGIVFLRAGILVLCLFLLFVRARAQNASLIATWLIVSLAGLISLGFTSDRPQLFSYLFAALIFLVLEWYEKYRKAKYLLVLPLIGLIWANTHGGFILLVVLLFIYVLLDSLQSLAKNKSIDGHAIWLIGIFISFVLATLLTPNGITTYQYLFSLEGSQLQSMTSEYRSSFKLYELGYMLPQLWVVLIYALSLVALFGLFRAPPNRLLIMFLLAAISAWSYRYFAFFIFISGPYIAQGVTLAMRDYRFGEIQFFQVINKYSGLLFLIVALVMLGFGLKNNWIFHKDVKASMYPVGATEFIKAQGLHGKVFNHMQWGGYLIWHLYPDLEIYIDGRMLEESKIPPYTNMLWATPEGLGVFNKAQFDFVMIPLKNRFTGEAYTLNNYLLTRKDWQVIYKDKDMYLFRKNSL
jgi:hypothetical protein